MESGSSDARFETVHFVTRRINALGLPIEPIRSLQDYIDHCNEELENNRAAIEYYGQGRIMSRHQPGDCNLFTSLRRIRLESRQMLDGQ